MWYERCQKDRLTCVFGAKRLVQTTEFYNRYNGSWPGSWVKYNSNQLGYSERLPVRPHCECTGLRLTLLCIWLKRTVCDHAFRKGSTGTKVLHKLRMCMVFAARELRAKN